MSEVTATPDPTPDAAPGLRPALSIDNVLRRATIALKPALALADVPSGGMDLWRERLRYTLWELLGGPGAMVEPHVETVEQFEERGVVRSRIRYQTEPGVETSAWLLMPARGRDDARPGFLALHGHGAGKDDVLGLADDDEAERHIEQRHYAYGGELAERGYVVLAPDARGFGERSSGSCGSPGLVALYHGRCIAGQRLWDDMRSVDLLAALDGVDPDRIACGGLSEGGKRALLLGALDDRVRLTVISGYFTSLRAEIDQWDRLDGWDICNAIPGLLRWADLPDVAALIAPRHLIVESGAEDPLYTPEAVVSAFAACRTAWDRLGVPDHVTHDLFDGEHEWHGTKAYPRLAALLHPRPYASSAKGVME